jgi:small-conductance mechanosensitive channel
MTVKAKPAPAPSAAPARDKTAKPAATVKTPPPAKQAAKSPAKEPAAAPLAAKPKAVKAEKPAKADKPKKTKMVRDSFTMPENDYAQLAELKKKCLQASVHVKKSELLRAGLLSLSNLPVAALIKAVEQVEKLKAGRPAKP